MAIKLAPHASGRPSSRRNGAPETRSLKPAGATVVLQQPDSRPKAKRRKKRAKDSDPRWQVDGVPVDLVERAVAPAVERPAPMQPVPGIGALQQLISDRLERRALCSDWRGTRQPRQRDDRRTAHPSAPLRETPRCVNSPARSCSSISPSRLARRHRRSQRPSLAEWQDRGETYASYEPPPRRRML